MRHLSTEVESAIQGTGPIEKPDILRWIEDGDLATKARVYALTASAWSRIRPAMSMDEQCGFMSEYLLECLATNPDGDDDYLHGGFEAGHAIAGWLKHLLSMPETAVVIANVAAGLEALYRRGDQDTRIRIEQGALEHLLEEPRLRRFFAHWETDPLLREAYEPALEWGVAHEQ
jgi:hypothetical protein